MSKTQYKRLNHLKRYWKHAATGDLPNSLVKGIFIVCGVVIPAIMYIVNGFQFMAQ